MIAEYVAETMHKLKIQRGIDKFRRLNDNGHEYYYMRCNDDGTT
jgi:UDP-2,3-diacylglucosamine pyrophosphatase LpxH